MTKKKESVLEEFSRGFFQVAAIVIAGWLLLTAITSTIANGVSKGYNPRYLYKIEYTFDNELRNEFFVGTRKEVEITANNEEARLTNYTENNWDAEIIFIN